MADEEEGGQEVKRSKNGNWFGGHKILSVLMALIAIGVIVSAANGGNKANVNTAASTAPGGSNRAASSKAPPSVAKVGDKINLGGSKGLAVTLLEIIDPSSSSDQYATPDAGKRFVATKLQIKNNGTDSYQDDANNNVTLVGSDNQSYTADFSTVSGCTNFSDGQYTIAPSENTTGCVVFQLPNTVKVDKVQFQTESGFSGSVAEWSVK